MIYLIGGPPRCGKTTIAKKLSKSWISADTIESIIRTNTNETDLDRLFPKNAVRKKTKNSNDLMYSVYSAKQIVNLYIKQAKASWKAIETMVECEISNGHDYVIEGFQLHPQLMNRLVKKYGKKNITPIVLTRFDCDGIVSGCLKHKAKSDWFIEKTKDSDIYPKIAKMIQVYSEIFEKEAKKFKIKVISVDGDFPKQIKEVLVHLKMPR